MTRLRQRMLDAMILRGFAPRSQDVYLGAVIRLSQHYNRSPDLLSDDQTQAYLLHLLKAASPRPLQRQLEFMRRAIFDLRCAGPDRATIANTTGRSPQRLPELLSRAEVAALLGVPILIKARNFLMVAVKSGLHAGLSPQYFFSLPRPKISSVDLSDGQATW